jgi:hypothetical protein
LAHLTGNAEGWQIQTVSARGNTGRFTDLVLDANGYPHLSYIEEVPFLSGPDQQLHYAYWDGIRWHQALVAQDLTIEGVYDYTSIDLDTNGRPHIAFIDNNKLHYASWNGEKWQIQTVDNSIGVSTHPSLLLDTNERPHVSYRRGYDLVYAFWNGEAWQIEVVDANLAGSFNSLALDVNNNPHISYVGEGELRYAAYYELFWTIQTVDASEEINRATSLSLAANGSPRISYVAASGNLKYANWNGENWQTEIVATLPTSNVEVALALDTADKPHIVYAGSLENVPLTYLHQADEIWQSQTLDASSGYPRLYNALALDDEGHIHVSYYEGTYDDLRYVTWDTNWLSRTVEAPAAIQATSLQLSQGNPYISYYDGLTAEVKLVAWEETWNQIPLPLNPISNQVQQTSLATTSSEIHMSYTVSELLIYLVWDGEDWNVQVVDNSAMVGDYSQVLVVGSNDGGPVRIAY